MHKTIILCLLIHVYETSSPNAADSASAGSAFTSLQRQGPASYEERLADLRSDSADARTANASLSPEPERTSRIWAGVFEQRQRMLDKGDTRGYAYKPLGFSIGYDHGFGDLVVSMQFTFSNGRFHQNGATDERFYLWNSPAFDVNDDTGTDNGTRLLNYQGNLYVSKSFANGIFASLSGGYIQSEFERKQLVVVQSVVGLYRIRGYRFDNYRPHTALTNARLGYDWRPTASLSLTPSIGFDYSYAWHSRYDYYFWTLSPFERDRYLQAVPRSSSHSLSVPLRLAAKYTFAGRAGGRFAIGANAGYAYEFNNKGKPGLLVLGGVDGDTAPRLNYNGRRPGRSTWSAGAEVSYESRWFEVDLKYNAHMGSKYFAHRLEGSVGLRF